MNIQTKHITKQRRVRKLVKSKWKKEVKKRKSLERELHRVKKLHDKSKKQSVSFEDAVNSVDKAFSIGVYLSQSKSTAVNYDLSGLKLMVCKSHNGDLWWSVSKG